MAGFSTNGPDNYIALGKQSDRDTDASSFYFLRHLDGSMIDPNPDIQREREGGDGQRIGLSYRSRVQADPALNAYARPEWAAHAFTGALGADASVSAVATGSLYKHLIIPTTTIPYYTVDQYSIDDVTRALNNKFTQLELTFESGRPFRLDAQLVNGGTYFDRPVASVLTPTRETVKPLMYPFASVGITGAASMAAQVTKGKLTITRDIDADIQGNSLARADVVEQNQDYQLDLTIKFEDSALWRTAHMNGGSAAGLDLATLGFNLFAQRGSHTMRVNAPLMEITGLKLNMLDPDGKTMYYDVAAADIGHASHAVFAEIVTGATAAY